jgi:hypothetical protein
MDYAPSGQGAFLSQVRLAVKTAATQSEVRLRGLPVVFVYGEVSQPGAQGSEVSQW